MAPKLDLGSVVGGWRVQLFINDDDTKDNDVL